jgi:hypothetical protein
VAEPRKLVTLQGVTGRGQEKLPRRLGFVIQRDLQGKPRDSKRILWKSVQIVCLELQTEALHKLRTGDAVTPPQAASQATCLRACSACAGDYEDPELTAWGDASEEEGDDEASADNAEPSVTRERFPVREE